MDAWELDRSGVDAWAEVGLDRLGCIGRGGAGLASLGQGYMGRGRAGLGQGWGWASLGAKLVKGVWAEVGLMLLACMACCNWHVSHRHPH